MLPPLGSRSFTPHTHKHTHVHKLFYDAQMNASHFLFTFDLPLSPKMTEQKEERGVKKREGRRGGKPDRGRGKERKEEERRRGKTGGAGGGQLLLLLSPYLLSLSLYFFSFCLSKGKLGGQSFATSSLQLVPHQPNSVFGSKMTSAETAQGFVHPNGGRVFFFRRRIEVGLRVFFFKKKELGRDELRLSEQDEKEPSAEEKRRGEIITEDGERRETLR